MKIIILFFSLFLFSSLNAQNYAALIKKAEESYEQKDLKKSGDYYTEAFKIDNKKSDDLYNAACIFALSKNNEEAFKWLNLSVDKGWLNLDHLKIDSDLNNLHGDKKWQKIIEKLENKIKIAEAKIDQPLRKELLAIYEDDQNGRVALQSIEKRFGPESPEIKEQWKMIDMKDADNLQKVKKILDEKGWVGQDKVGGKANSTLFLVIQHADLETQKKYLPMMMEAVKKGNASSSSMALLLDRIEVREGRKQIYGSQIGTDPDTHLYYVLPLADPDNVDKRRAEMVLDPIASYIKHWNLTWDAEKYKKDLPAFEKMNEKSFQTQ